MLEDGGQKENIKTRTPKTEVDGIGGPRTVAI